jgi:hypothetical protein
MNEKQQLIILLISTLSLITARDPREETFARPNLTEDFVKLSGFDKRMFVVCRMCEI